GLHVIAGSGLTYYYKSLSGSGWFKKGLGYNTGDYDLWFSNNGKPVVLFSRDHTIYQGIGDTLGNFTIFTVDTPGPGRTRLYSYDGPVAFGKTTHGALLYFSCFYFSKALTPTCFCFYGVNGGYPDTPCFAIYSCSDCGAECCDWEIIPEIASDYEFLVYYAYYENKIKTYPMNSSRTGYMGPDISKRGNDYAISAVKSADGLVYFFRELYAPTGEPVCSTRARGPTSIVAKDTSQVFIAFVGVDSILRVAYGSSSGDTGEPPPPDSLPPPIFGSIILRAPSQSGGYIRFTAGASGLMDCSLYRADGTKAYAIAREVKEGEEIRIPVRKLGPGVYYLWIRIAGYEKRFRVVIL
ncbi:MAG: hypothetical protein ABIM46_07975, partial [candidate division WOR-3 bacterium]